MSADGVFVNSAPTGRRLDLDAPSSRDRVTPGTRTKALIYFGDFSAIAIKVRTETVGAPNDAGQVASAVVNPVTSKPPASQFATACPLATIGQAAGIPENAPPKPNWARLESIFAKS